MNFDPKVVRRALMVAKDIATKIDPGFAVHNLPMPPQGVPLERAKGGPIKTVQGPERDQNLAEFMRGAHPNMFDDRGVPRRFYHGTSTSNIEKFKGHRGVAGHFSFEPKLANEWAKAYGEKEQEILESGEEDLGDAAQVYAVHLNAKNPFDARNPAHLAKIGKPNTNMKDWAILEENLPEIKKAGFDSFYDWEYSSQDPDGIAVFHPHQIKSAVGNIGTFDPADPDITKAEGGSVDAPQIGINVRSDTKAGIRYADEIVDGNKAYETRDTDSLRPYVGKRVAIVRTGEGPARAIGEVTVGKPIVADQNMFHRLRDQHLVPAGSAFDIKPGSTKHLYPMHNPVRYDNERGVGAGIVARKVMERAKGGPIKTVQGLEREQNLKDWLGNSFLHVDGVPRTYYHGTSKDTPFSSFKVGRHGAWFASDPKEASMYATENDSMSSRYEGGRFVPTNTASRVMPVYLKASNPYMGEFPEKYKNVDNYKKAQSDWFDELRSAGYDSWVPRSQQGNLAVMLEGPHQVKSAVGNDGTFDHPTDITKAEGGEVDTPDDSDDYVYHVTHTERVPEIQEKGLLPLQTSNWVQEGNKERYGGGDIYAFTHKDDARRWAAKMDWTFNQKMGSGKVSVLTVRKPKNVSFTVDKNDPLSQVGNKGQWVKTGSHIPAEHIVSAEPYDPKKIAKAEGGAIDDELQQRQLNRMGMYSAAADAARALPQSVGTPQQMLASLKGVKPDELQWSGAQQAFANKPRVTKDELARHFDENLPTLRVNSLEEDDSQAAINKYEDVNLRLPGGSNYKEDLIHLNRGNELKRQEFYTPDPTLVAVEKPKTYQSSIAPFSFSDKKYEIRDANGKLLDEISGPYTNSPGGALDSYHRKQAYRKENDWKKLNTFRSSHYDDQNNIVAHVRRADRIGPDKEKILHLEEVQSDWGQTARDKGLNNPIVPGTVVPEEQGTWRINWPDNTYSAGYGSKEIAEQMAQERAVEKSKYVPSGPYIDTTSKWTDVALKHALNEAAKGNYDSIIWTPGDVQADRYDLSKQIKQLYHRKNDDGTYELLYRLPTGAPNDVQKLGDNINKEKLSAAVGKDLAKKIIEGTGSQTIFFDSKQEKEKHYKTIEGEDLKIGGEGMKSYYDKILPGRLLALAQEHDPKAKLETLDHPDDKHVNGFPMLKITPRMRDSILKRGFKAFKRGGAVQGHLFHHHDEPKSVEVPVMDREKAVRRALMIAKQEGGPIGGTQSTKGLPFPEEETAFRLRTKLNREAKVAAGKADPGLPSNPRMVIRAPKAKESETQLPNFIVGPLTHKDWIARHEKILSPEEIQHSSQWYKNIYGNFLQYTNNNEPEAKKLMRAWLVAQQNVSPAGAMQNVLLQREQMQRGVPEPLWRAGGMPNPTNAARSVLRDQPISGGVGQKISDFVDSAEGLDTRSYLGHDPQGGSPFVIDVHSARDAGLVDPALINHLKNLGYNENDLAKVQTDFEASPSDAQYENRAQWGRDLTKYLNKIGWQGKKDWRPEEIQAVGWMGMTKLTRNAEEDSASGLGRNLRRVSFELSPGEGSPWAQKYGTAFESLPDEERYGITQKMSNRAMQIASELSGVNPLSTVHGTGAWMQYQNPAAVGQALATQGGADIMANTIGHLLHQTEVWHNRVKPVTSSPKGFAIDFIESGSQNLADRGQLRDFWQKITDADKTGLIQGYQPITLPNGQVGVRALVDKGGLGTHKKLTETLQEGGDLDKMLKELPFDVESQIAEAEITKAGNDWKENQNGQAYLQRLSDLMGSDPSARLSAYGSQLEKELQGHLDEAYARQGRSWRATTPQGQQTQVKAPETPPLPTMAYGGAIDKALQIAQRART